MGTTRHPLVSMSQADRNELKARFQPARSGHPWKDFRHVNTEELVLIEPRVVVEVVLDKGNELGDDYWTGEAKVLRLCRDGRAPTVGHYGGRRLESVLGYSLNPEVRLLP